MNKGIIAAGAAAAAAGLFLMKKRKAGDAQAFVKKATRGGKAEVELGRIATERASSADVRNFGQRMVYDHTKANEELKQLARERGLEVPMQLDSKHRELADRLGKLSGKEFDEKFVTAMIADHEKVVALFQKFAANGDDAGIRAFAERTVPALEEHRQMA
jgi:putative membrane protein